MATAENLYLALHLMAVN